ncbi:hypothetical protein AUJ77_03695 [Candidatus Nomurabacteria bacterium CG1_02_43_90]|uniref:Uncharacterized protein n=1 Tax=Candidatus Nomurabacteria bacterium CG1_02_43_90 TaxID=1805281 RepID=A0A1J4V2L4_9BACT|nr:MAG: hypothetical protein AUJ77_03695 [Candidatus Nomurabacteria bacterium CG1_02_43_90]
MGEKIFKGGVIIFLLLFLFVVYAIVGGINDRSEVQGERIAVVEGDIKEIKIFLKGAATKDDLSKVVAEDARDDGERIALHERGPLHAKPVVKHHNPPPAVRAVAPAVRQVAVAEPKLVLPKVGDPCPYGVVSIEVTLDGVQHLRCGPVAQQVSVPQQVVVRETVREQPAPRDDFYDHVEYVPRRQAPITQPLTPQPVKPEQEASSGSVWPWIGGAAALLTAWYINAHRGGNTLPVGLGPTAVTNGVGTNPVGVVGGAPTAVTQ